MSESQGKRSKPKQIVGKVELHQGGGVDITSQEIHYFEDLDQFSQEAIVDMVTSILRKKSKRGPDD